MAARALIFVFIDEWQEDEKTNLGILTQKTYRIPAQYSIFVMMKRIAYIFTSLLLITLIAYGGSGVNLYFFCCDDCRDDGVIKAIVEHSCCERHHHNHSESIAHNHESGCCCAPSHDARHSMHTSYTSCDETSHGACNVQRISVNWQTAQSENPEIAPTSFDVFSSTFCLFTPQNYDLKPTISFIRYSDTQKPPNLDKDIYLSLLNTLII